MLSNERCRTLFEAHAKVSPCEVCKVAVETPGFFLTSCECGWSLAQAELASTAPDADVAVVSTIDDLELEGWAFNEQVVKKNGRIVHGTPPIGFLDRVTQVSLGTLDGNQLFMLLVNGVGYIRGRMLTERTIKDLKEKLTTLAEDMRSLTDHDVDSNVAEACAAIEASAK